jgi:hypothetical protein
MGPYRVCDRLANHIMGGYEPARYVSAHRLELARGDLIRRGLAEEEPALMTVPAGRAEPAERPR